MSLDSTKLSDIFSLDQTSELSRDMEDAALHIIKHKMSASKSNIVSFRWSKVCKFPREINGIDEPLFNVPIDQVRSHKISIWIERLVTNFHILKFNTLRHLYQT